MPSFQICLPRAFSRPVDQSRFRSGTLDTYTCARGASARNCRSDASKEARKSATGVISSTESRQASLAPIITVTSSGRSFAASAICSGSCAIRAPDTAWFQLCEAAFEGPRSRSARLRTASSVPVAHDTSGQSASTEQASKPRVMESPTAATEAGLAFHAGVGDGLREGRAVLPPSPAPPQPVNTATPTVATAVSAAAARRTRWRDWPSAIPISLRSCGRSPLAQSDSPRWRGCAPWRVNAGRIMGPGPTVRHTPGAGAR
ncbi:hypothetical protein GA0115235_110970 [Streptomyces sp. DpondAA-F4a]|nr:hypothetical protein GA0115235_110970 [Streptomyces sp. DpondAA-F4a]